jgi:hypothetical protein
MTEAIVGIVLAILGYFGFTYVKAQKENAKLKKQEEIREQEAKFDEIRKTTASTSLDNLISDHNSEIKSRGNSK